LSRKLLLKLSFLFILLLVACASNRWATQIDWQDFSLPETPTRDQYPHTPAIILLDEGQLEVSSRQNVGSSSFIRKTIIKVLKAAGKEYANVMIPFSPNTVVSDIKARTISADSQITVLHEENIFDVNLYPRYIFYSDIRAKIFTLPAVDEGSIIEYTYTKTFPNRTYLHNWVFQSEIPTLISRFTLTIPYDWEYKSQNYYIDLEPFKEAHGPEKTSTYTWEARDIPEFLPEPSMPPASRFFKRIEFSPSFAKDWSEIGKWYFQLAQARMEPDQPLKNFTEQLVTNLSDEREILARIYNFVQQKIRYVAISIGIGSFQPHFAAETFRQRYGDCKDMSTLIVAMARAAGIKAWPVLISTYQNGPVDTAHVSYTQFNHIIACAQLNDSQLVWMDATDKTCPFGALPWYDQGRWVFAVQDSGKARFIQTPLNPPERNSLRREWQLELQTDGSLTGSVEFVFSGAKQDIERRFLENIHPHLQEQWLFPMLTLFCPGAVLDSFKITDLDSFDKPLQIHFRFHVSNFVNQRPEDLILEGTILKQKTYETLFPDKPRKFPVHLRFLEKETDFITFHFPPDIDIQYLPKDQLITNSFGEYELKFITSEKTLNIYRLFKTKQIRIMNLDYQDWCRFLQAIAVIERDKIIFTKKN